MNASLRLCHLLGKTTARMLDRASRGQAQSKDSNVSCRAPRLEHAAAAECVAAPREAKFADLCFLPRTATVSSHGGSEDPRISRSVPCRFCQSCCSDLGAAGVLRACQALNSAMTVQCAQGPSHEPRTLPLGVSSSSLFSASGKCVGSS